MIVNLSGRGDKDVDTVATLKAASTRRCAMTTKLQQAFSTLRATGRKGVVPYITAGDPDLETTYNLLVAMARGGATAIELGVPFSDPAADGPVIQRACERALARGVKLNAVLEVAGRAASATGIPIVLFSYLNPLLARSRPPGAGRRRCGPRRSAGHRSSRRSRPWILAGPAAPRSSNTVPNE